MAIIHNLSHMIDFLYYFAQTHLVLALSLQNCYKGHGFFAVRLIQPLQSHIATPL